jgi:hypothetical protein
MPGQKARSAVFTPQKARSAVFAPNDPDIHDELRLISALWMAVLAEKPHGLPGQARQ